MGGYNGKDPFWVFPIIAQKKIIDPSHYGIVNMIGRGGDYTLYGYMITRGWGACGERPLNCGTKSYLLETTVEPDSPPPPPPLCIPCNLKQPTHTLSNPSPPQILLKTVIEHSLRGL